MNKVDPTDIGGFSENDATSDLGSRASAATVATWVRVANATRDACLDQEGADPTDCRKRALEAAREAVKRRLQEKPRPSKAPPAPPPEEEEQEGV